MTRLPIATICGSNKFKNTMLEVYKNLTERGFAVFLPAIGCTKHDEEWHMRLHFKKIEMSDLVYIVDAGLGSERIRTPSYIGEGTKAEIAHAKENHKEVVYFSSDICERGDENV